MADTKDFEEIQSLSVKLEQSVQSIADAFSKSTSKASDLSRILDQIARDQEKSKIGVKIQETMVKTGLKFSQIQEKALKVQKSSIKEYYRIAEKKLEQQLKSVKDINKQEKIREVFNNKIKTIEKDVDEALQKQLVKSSKLKKAFTNVGGAMKESFLKLDEASKQKELKSASDVLLKPFDDLLESVPVVGGLLKFAFTSIRRAFFSVWDYIEQRVLPTNRKLIEDFGTLAGGVGEVGKQSIAMGNRFLQMTDNFEEGRDAVEQFYAGLQTTKFDQFGVSIQDLTSLGTGLIKVVGLNAQQATQLAIAFDRSGESLDQVTESMLNQSNVVAKEYGVNLNQIRKDMGENIDILQRFGVSNRLQFTQSTALARAYGTNIKDVTQAFGGQLDTFEKTSSAAAKLNTIFGTQINSYELMLETDPTKRMVMLGKELKNVGRNWGNLNVQEKNVIKSTLGIDETMGSLAFSQKNVNMTTEEMNKAINDQLKQQAKQQTAQEKWDKSISGLKTKLLNFEEAINKIVRALGDTISRMLGFGPATKNVTNTAEGLKKLFGDIAKSLESWNASGGPERLRETLMKIFNGLEKAAQSPIVKAVFGLDEDQEIHQEIPGFSKYTKMLEDRQQQLEEVKNSLSELPKSGGSIKQEAQRLSGEKETLEKQINIIDGHIKNQERLFAQDKGARKNFNLEDFEQTLNKKLAMASVDDALITKEGKIVKFNAQDNILATKKDPSEMMSSASNDIKDLIKAIREMKSSDNVKVEVLDVIMDGRKVGNAQVRIARS